MARDEGARERLVLGGTLAAQVQRDGRAPRQQVVEGGDGVAEAALADLAPYFPGMKPAWTATAPLPGGDLRNGDRAALLAALCARYPGLPVDLLRALARRHGTLATDVLGDAASPADLGEDFGAGLTEREVEHLVAHEWAREPDDVLWRRTKCGLAMTSAERERAAGYVRAAAARA